MHIRYVSSIYLSKFAYCQVWPKAVNFNLFWNSDYYWQTYIYFAKAFKVSRLYDLNVHIVASEASIRITVGIASELMGNLRQLIKARYLLASFVIIASVVFFRHSRKSFHIHFHQQYPPNIRANVNMNNQN